MMGELGSQSDRIISIEEKLIRAKKEDDINKWKEVSIYRVPRSIKCRKPDLYEPKIVSFGPYHRSNPKVREAEAHKCRALHYMLKRNNQEVAQYLDALREQEQRARSCYEEEISLSSDQFVEMMVLDGCFLIECLLSHSLRNKNSLGYPVYIPIFHGDEILKDVMSDMLLMENQIPLFVLRTLAAIQRNPFVDMELINTEATRWFNLKICMNDAEPPYLPMEKEVLHILEMIMQKQNFDQPKFTNDNAKVIVFPCASKLKEAGVKFLPREDNPFWLIEFSKGTLKLPKLCFQGDSETIFHNAVHYELRHRGCVKIIIPYCIFMSQLIRSPKDVDHLTEAGIIQNLGSNEELVKLFSDIDVTFDFKKVYLCDVADRINRHFNSRRNKLKASLKDTYFSLGIHLAVFLIIILTFAQTFFTVFPRK